MHAGATRAILKATNDVEYGTTMAKGGERGKNCSASHLSTGREPSSILEVRDAQELSCFEVINYIPLGKNGRRSSERGS